MANLRNRPARLRSRYVAAGMAVACLSLAAAAQAGWAEMFPGDFTEEMEVTAPLEHVSEGGTICRFGWWDPTLREKFDMSDLVIAGRVGSSEILEVNEGKVEVETRLRVGRLFKGVVLDRFVIYRYSLPVRAFDQEARPLAELTPGSMVLAFLERADNKAGRQVFEAAGDYSGVQGIALDGIAAYCDLLDNLAGFQQTAEILGEPDPAVLMEWRVAAAENPRTRKESTASEIVSELMRLEAFAHGPVNNEATDPPEVGVSLTEDQRVRLASALRATESMTLADLDLFRLVRRLDPGVAAAWLADTLTAGAIPEGRDILGRLKEFAESLPKGEADSLLDAAKKQVEALETLFPGGEASLEARAEWEFQRMELARSLFADLAPLLFCAG